MIGIICDAVKVTGGYEGSELKDRTGRNMMEVTISNDVVNYSERVGSYPSRSSDSRIKSMT